MTTETDLERRIRELEEENARLRKKNTLGGEYNAREDTYKGSPILVFERPNSRPFSLGASKLIAIQKCWHKVEAFLKKHGDKANSDGGAGGRSPNDRI